MTAPVLRSIAHLLEQAVKRPGDIPGYLFRQFRKSRAQLDEDRYFADARKQLYDLVIQEQPIEVVAGSEVVITTLVGKRGLQDAICAFQSLLPYVPDADLVVIEDGTLEAEDVRQISRAFPGASVLRRDDARSIVIEELRRSGLQQCAKFRLRSAYALKLFDLQMHFEGRRVLYMDSDILFYKRPDELIAALRQPSETFKPCFNVDVRESYTWKEEDVLRVAGLGYPRVPVNSGLFVVHPRLGNWARYEACFSLPERAAWDEQNLWAVEMSALGGVPLSADYDVCFRYAWDGMDRSEMMANRALGRPVISQHFCGGRPFREMFYAEALLRGR
jgi:hypothetical protein